MFNKLSETMHTETGKIIISLILGFGLASLFRKTCNDKACLEFKGPPVKQVEKTIYKHDKNCYKFKTETINCKKDRKLEIASS